MRNHKNCKKLICKIEQILGKKFLKYLMENMRKLTIFVKNLKPLKSLIIFLLRPHAPVPHAPLGGPFPHSTSSPLTYLDRHLIWHF